jgi:ABC-type bacteriocin/lantibiotic exporter with double-glycine peptidase domain
MYVLHLFEKRDQKKIYLVSLLQFLLAFLDLIGIFFIGILGSVTIYGVQSKVVGDRTTRILEILQIDNLSFHRQALFLSIVSFSLLLSKTVLSAYLTKRTLYFLSIKGAQLSSNLITSIFSANPDKIKSYRKMDIVYGASVGMDAISTRILATSVGIFSDFSLLVILFLGTLIINPISTLIAFFTFGLAYIYLNKLIKGKALRIGQAEMNLGMKANHELMEGLNIFNELLVHDRQNAYAKKLSATRQELGLSIAHRSSLPILSKLFFELSLLIGTLLVAAIQFIVYDATYAIAGLGIFFAAASRIAPAILRLQQNLTTIKIALGSSEKTIKLLETFNNSSLSHSGIELKAQSVNDENFVPHVQIKSVQFKYEDESTFSLSDINLDFKPGSFNAIIGPSGSGKSTVINLILGINKPVSGTVLISDTDPLSAFKRWPGACSYVPQDNFIIDGSIEQNIALGFAQEEINSNQIHTSIEMSDLSKFIGNLPNKERTYVGDGGNLISGGQKQRLVIARALYTSPKLLILDEATSALDVDSENQIAKVLEKLKGNVTVIVIAHRLSSVKNADQVIYLDSGKIRAIGNLDQIRNEIPDFDKTVKIFGGLEN